MLVAEIRPNVVYADRGIGERQRCKNTQTVGRRWRHVGVVAPGGSGTFHVRVHEASRRYKALLELL
jgi:hypothetical protein